jgi:hypothetical protein
MTFIEQAIQLGFTPEESKEIAVKALKEAIKERLGDREGLAEVIPISPTQYTRLKTVDAIEIYLRARGEPVSYDDLIRALKVGGCEISKDAHHNYKTIRIVVAMNPGRLEDDGTGMVRLAEGVRMTA